MSRSTLYSQYLAQSRFTLHMLVERVKLEAASGNGEDEVDMGESVWIENRQNYLWWCWEATLNLHRCPVQLS